RSPRPSNGWSKCSRTTGSRRSLGTRKSRTERKNGRFAPCGGRPATSTSSQRPTGDLRGCGYAGFQPLDGAAHAQRCVEDASHLHASAQLVTADRFEPCRGNAAAIRAVWVAAELTRRDAPFQIRGKAIGRSGKDAVI